MVLPTTTIKNSSNEKKEGQTFELSDRKYSRARNYAEDQTVLKMDNEGLTPGMS